MPDSRALQKYGTILRPHRNCDWDEDNLETAQPQPCLRDWPPRGCLNVCLSRNTGRGDALVGPYPTLIPSGASFGRQAAHLQTL